MTDFCDGELYGSHQLYKTDENALQLILYFDEIEPFNNLGSASGKYKLGTCTPVLYIIMCMCI